MLGAFPRQPKQIYNVENSLFFQPFLIILFGCFVIRVKGSNKNHLRIKVDSHVMLHCSNTSVEGFELRVQKGSENRDEKIHIKAHHRNQSSSLYGRRDVK